LLIEEGLFHWDRWSLLNFLFEGNNAAWGCKILVPRHFQWVAIAPKMGGGLNISCPARDSSLAPTAIAPLVVRSVKVCLNLEETG
jgi:hypothetical protein